MPPPLFYKVGPSLTLFIFYPSSDISCKVSDSLPLISFIYASSLFHHPQLLPCHGQRLYALFPYAALCTPLRTLHLLLLTPYPNLLSESVASHCVLDTFHAHPRCYYLPGLTHRRNHIILPSINLHSGSSITFNHRPYCYNYITRFIVNYQLHSIFTILDAITSLFPPPSFILTAIFLRCRLISGHLHSQH